METSLQIGQSTAVVYLFCLSIFSILALMLLLGWNYRHKKSSLCPYTQLPLKLGADLARSIQNHINQFILQEEHTGNSAIDFSKAAISEQTGRIFPQCVKGECISIDWSFLEKKYHGSYVSWGFLSEHEKAVFRLLHLSFDGFQIEHSSTNPLPKSVEKSFIYLHPGPLYIDRITKVVIGWKQVPGTSFEVLLVQHPIYQSIDDTL